MRQTKDFAIIFITNDMVIDLYRLGALMKNRIFNDSNGTHIINKKWCRLSLWKAKIRTVIIVAKECRTSE